MKEMKERDNPSQELEVFFERFKDSVAYADRKMREEGRIVR
jgi:hypothetical protein